MNCSKVLYVGNDNLVELIGLNNGVTDLPVNDATTSASIYDGATLVTGSAVAMPYVAASNGDYRGNFNEDLALVAMRKYTVKVVADPVNLGLHGHWEVSVTAMTRTG